MPLQNIDEAIGILINLGYVVIDHKEGSWNIPKGIKPDKIEINGMLRLFREIDYAQRGPDYSAICVDESGKPVPPSLFLTDEQSIISFASQQSEKYAPINKNYLL